MIRTLPMTLVTFQGQTCDSSLRLSYQISRKRCVIQQSYYKVL